MYACINYQKKLFMGITAEAAGGLGGVKTSGGASGAGGVSMDLSEAGISLGLSKGKAEMFALEEVELLEQVDLLEPLANHLE